MPSPTELAWLAGLIDGEGYVGIKISYYTRKGEAVQRPSPCPFIDVGMTHEETIARCREITGLGNPGRRELKNRIKPLYTWAVYATNARQVAEWVLPYAVTKREKLLEVISVPPKVSR